MPTNQNEEQLELTYIGVFVRNRNHVIVPTIVDKFSEDRRDHALVYHWLNQEWVQHLIENSICGVSALSEPSTKVFNVGVDGKVVVASIPGKSEEIVDSSERGPNYSETLRCVRKIGSHIYVAGMARQVYRRESDGLWVKWDDGVYVPRGKREVATGFLDISGSSDELLYAVGYKGEIWHYDKKKWAQEDSPTNIALTQVCFVNPSEIYVAGLSGVVFRGSRGAWRKIDQDVTESDFWGITELNGCVYFSNYDGVFVLKNDTLVHVDLGFDRKLTTAYLHASDGVMWSVGQKDLAYSFDGTKWFEAEKP